MLPLGIFLIVVALFIIGIIIKFNSNKKNKAEDLAKLAESESVPVEDIFADLGIGSEIPKVKPTIKKTVKKKTVKKKAKPITKKKSNPKK